MSADPRSRAECVLAEVLVAEEVEVLPDVHAGFLGLEHAGTDWIARMSAAGAVRTVAACEAAIARTQAVQLRALARRAALRGDPRSAAAEVALAVSTTESRARAQLVLAKSLTTRLPHTLAAMAAGSIDSYKAGKVADATAALDDTAAAEADVILADRLAGKNPANSPDTGRSRPRSPAPSPTNPTRPGDASSPTPSTDKSSTSAAPATDPQSPSTNSSASETAPADTPAATDPASTATSTTTTNGPPRKEPPASTTSSDSAADTTASKTTPTGHTTSTTTAPSPSPHPHNTATRASPNPHPSDMA